MRAIAVGMALALAAAAEGGCASHRIRLEDLRRAAMADLGRADVRLLEGCYACLVEARGTYDRLANGPIASLASLRRFGADLLLVLREKELAIDVGPSMSRLEADAAGLPDGMDAPRLLKLVDLVAPNAAGLSDVEYSTFIRDHAPKANLLDDDVVWLENASLWAPVRAYLMLSVQCSDLGRPLLAIAHRWHDTGPVSDDPALLVYRRAVCAGAAGFPALEDLRETTPRLTEAAYVLARSAPLATEHVGPSKTKALAADALRDLPQSPAVTYLMAMIQQMAGDCRDALRLYTATLVLRDRHENAQVGRTACLTFLSRPDEAIEAATTLIGWHSTNLRDAFYWRAYNRHILQRLDEARQDIDRSKQFGSTVQNRTLAGIIEYEQNDMMSAVIDLDRGWALGLGGNCAAAWYQGLVHVKREAWGEAGGGFERALGCYLKNVAQDRTDLAGMEARTDLEPDFQRTQIENFVLALHEDQHQQWASAMNAANCVARSGDVAKAEALLLVASEDATLAADVATLRAVLAEQARTPASPVAP